MEEEIITKENTGTSYTTFIIVAVVSLVIGGVAGFFGAMYYSPMMNSNNLNMANNQMDMNLGDNQMPVQPIIHSIIGTIKSVSGDTFVLSVNSKMFGSNISERTVSINSKTVFLKLTHKDRAVFQKEIDAFMKKMNSASSSVDINNAMVPPMPYTEKTVSSQKLTEGMNVMVLSDENIKDKASFTASKIEIPDSEMVKEAKSAGAIK